MSRVGKAPIQLPDKVKVQVQGQTVKVEGPKGTLSMEMDRAISANLDENNVLTLTRSSEVKRNRALHGLTRALVYNMVTGVNEGFKRTLKVTGVGYRIEMRGNSLVLHVGFSHPIVVTPPDGVTLEANPKENTITVSGIDKQMVGQLAAKIRSCRPPEPYKGKGIRYIEEQVRHKAGKAGVGGGA